MRIDFERIRTGKNNRAILLGRTGCGKTTLAKFLMNDQAKPYSIVYDAKGMMNPVSWQNHHFEYSFKTIQEINPQEKPRIIYQPDFEASIDSNEQNEFFYWIYNRHNTRLYVDEAYSLLGGINPSRGLLACLSRGRERGISTIISSQRPARIPAVTLSEAEHYYIFQLSHPADKQRVEDITNGKITSEDIEELQPYQFYYYDAWNNQRIEPALKLQL